MEFQGLGFFSVPFLKYQVSGFCLALKLVGLGFEFGVIYIYIERSHEQTYLG